MRAVRDGLAVTAVGQQAACAVVFANEGSDMHLPVLKQALDDVLEESQVPVSHGNEQHEQHAQPFDILRLADAEFGAQMRLVRPPAAHDAAIIREQGRVGRIVGRESREAVENLDDRKRIAHEV